MKLKDYAIRNPENPPGASKFNPRTAVTGAIAAIALAGLVGSGALASFKGGLKSAESNVEFQPASAGNSENGPDRPGSPAKLSDSAYSSAPAPAPSSSPASSTSSAEAKAFEKRLATLEASIRRIEDTSPAKLAHFDYTDRLDYLDVMVSDLVDVQKQTSEILRKDLTEVKARLAEFAQAKNATPAARPAAPAAPPQAEAVPAAATVVSFSPVMARQAGACSSGACGVGMMGRGLFRRR